MGKYLIDDIFGIVFRKFFKTQKKKHFLCMLGEIRKSMKCLALKILVYDGLKHNLLLPVIFLNWHVCS